MSDQNSSSPCNTENAETLLSLEEFVSELRAISSGQKPQKNLRRYLVATIPSKVQNPVYKQLSYFDFEGLRIGLASISRRLFVHLDIFILENQKTALNIACQDEKPIQAEFHVSQSKIKTTRPVVTIMGIRDIACATDAQDADTIHMDADAILSETESQPGEASLGTDSQTAAVEKEQKKRVEKASYEKMLTGRK